MPFDKLRANGVGGIGANGVSGRAIPLVPPLRHVRQQHLQHHGLALDGTLAARPHLHARRYRAAAAGREHALAFDFHHAGAAVAVGAQALAVAKVGNVDTHPARRLQDGLALYGLDILAVEPEGDEGQVR